MRPYLDSGPRALCRSIRWRHSAYSLVPARYANELHHSSSESSRCIDEQLPSTSAASRSTNLKTMAAPAHVGGDDSGSPLARAEIYQPSDHINTRQLNSTSAMTVDHAIPL